MTKIQPLKKEEIAKVAKIAGLCFTGFREPKQTERWIRCNFMAFPRARYFTAKQGKNILGYVLWLEKGGFRKEAVFELEQIAVLPEARGRGVAKSLIRASLKKIRQTLAKRGSSLKLIEITTGVSNKAQNLYQKTLNAQTEAVIKNLFKEDEAIMIARFSKKPIC